ncbi:putative transmembrane protein [Gregarina niphandrodes]|uniref:Transmembrane protein n=1 Tax=Gregarina niphandrodes TaxID=110365 RepID=A0A023B0A5_GRENI|nr:putative transmembrane protein [Gregarina niphandrodes]EZG45078.1 putative transmembrane protein [Gregarina niphandrodes]|eukprot:XP_011132582.1 putative transmembrane protein [Gregarina niphandrodes]
MPTERVNYLEDPNILGLESLFGLLSIVNVIVLHYLMAVVIPYPLVVTWIQLALGLLYTHVLGEFGVEYKDFNHFPPTRIFKEKLSELLIPSLAYLSMICSANMLLARVPSVAMYPVVASFAIVAHHAARFFGCGQIYRPSRWVALGVILLGYFISAFDYFAVGGDVILLSLFFGLSTALYRAAFLERSLHITRGLSSELYVHQAVIGIVLLPVVIILSRERRFFTYMPTDFSRAWTWLMWGCLSTAASLPLLKNIVSNRLIRFSGQPPWRFLELFAIILVFVLGWAIFDRINGLSILAFGLVFVGRTLNTIDALRFDEAAAPPFKFTGPGGNTDYHNMDNSPKV